MHHLAQPKSEQATAAGLWRESGLLELDGGASAGDACDFYADFKSIGMRIACRPGCVGCPLLHAAAFPAPATFAHHHRPFYQIPRLRAHLH